MNKSFSLVEVLVASVIMLIVSVGTVKMSSNLRLQAEQKVGMTDLVKTISSIMDNRHAKIPYSKVKVLYIREMSFF
ncbi:MAG: prepilin-type N-terminal cleavage/methylation domain-containing protein [Bdellovibrionales bacterium]|nr:prepilin-type N-terminal cleavage/methylation domain-containing protein [Bdellovibrionales bacterium]